MLRRTQNRPRRAAALAAGLGLTLAAAVGATALGVTAQTGDAQPANAGEAPTQEPEQLRVEVIETLPHDVDAFTQGLEVADGALYEGTGRSGQSYVAATDLATGEERARADLPAPLFGEGITLTDSALWQLTWRDGVAFERDPETLEERRTVAYEGEGWGLCYQADPGRLVMSDGSDELTFRDPETFEETARVQVQSAGEHQTTNLNELECVGDEVYANVWRTDTILRIDPDAGAVTAEIDAAGLLTEEEARQADVLNGIAAVPESETFPQSDTFFVTGKLWPHLFQVRFVPATT